MFCIYCILNTINTYVSVVKYVYMKARAPRQLTFEACDIVPPAGQIK